MAAYHDAFISYAWSDGASAAETVHQRLDAHSIDAYRDDTPHGELPVGGVLSDEIKERIDASRMFVPVLTNGYFDGTTTELEYSYAASKQKPFVPVIVGPRASVTRLSDPPAWFKEKIEIVTGVSDSERGDAFEKLIRYTSPSQFIIRKVSEIAARDMLAALHHLAELERLIRPRDEHEVAVQQYQAELLRLAGKRQEAAQVIAACLPNASYSFQILQKTLVTSALLEIDHNEWREARLRLAEATAILSREEAWKSKSVTRRRLLAEVTRELARTYLAEALHTAHDEDVKNGNGSNHDGNGNGDRSEDICYELEIAWSLYLEALALVTVSEDRLCHAWVHENLGTLTVEYAKQPKPKVSSSGASAPTVQNLDYPFIARYRGQPALLVSQSRKHFTRAEELFRGYRRDQAKAREGLCWTKYHEVEATLLDNDSDTTKKQLIPDLLKLAVEFEGITEGQALTYERLYRLSLDLKDEENAKKYGVLAVDRIKDSEVHVKLAGKLRGELRAMGVTDV